ncbi:hypothetical protein ACFU7Y_27195 [Kitasatospora sp. NPDC057542]|uniref:hypothetical protein n=1 Tax=Kitasatospora sp. NPDC057542 TaxID=3346162 RepID=UPI0036BAE040
MFDLVEEFQESIFEELMDSRVLPDKRGRSETAGTYRLLGITVQWSTTAASGLLVPAAWPKGWQRVRAEADGYGFYLTDKAGILMVEAVANFKPYEHIGRMSLTDAGRREVRRRWRKLPETTTPLRPSGCGSWAGRSAPKALPACKSS